MSGWTAFRDVAGSVAAAYADQYTSGSASKIYAADRQRVAQKRAASDAKNAQWMAHEAVRAENARYASEQATTMGNASGTTPAFLRMNNTLKQRTDSGSVFITPTVIVVGTLALALVAVAARR